MAKPSMAGKKQRQRRLRMIVALFLVASMSIGLGLGFYLGVRGEKSAAKLFEDGRTALGERRYGDAADLFRKVLEREPDSVDALLGLGESLMNSGSVKEGVGYLKKVLELNPDNPNRAAIEQLIQQAGGP